MLGTTLDAIVDGLNARPNLSTVNVFSGPVSVEEGGTECISLLKATLIEIHLIMGGGREETWDIDGELWALTSTWQGDTESSIRHARDRALELFAEVETYINGTYTGALPYVHATAGELTQGYGPDGRLCGLEFTLTLRAAINP